MFYLVFKAITIIIIIIDVYNSDKLLWIAE